MVKQSVLKKWHEMKHIGSFFHYAITQQLMTSKFPFKLSRRKKNVYTLWSTPPLATNKEVHRKDLQNELNR